MYKLSQAAKDDLTRIVNTIIYSKTHMEDFASRNQWKKFRKARDEFNWAVDDLRKRFDVETVFHKAIKEEINRNVSTN